MRLTAAGVGYRFDDAVLLDDVDLDVAAGAMVGLVGPNGSGKSTLLRLLYRGLAPQDGVAWLDDDLLWAMPARRSARALGAVPQDQPSEFDLTVGELVALGRLPHQRFLAGDGAADRRIVTDALEATGIAHLAGRSLTQLSGGERQRAVVARALAQEPSVLVLDEPTNHLDVAYQHDLLGLLRGLGCTTLVALHDLNLAATYCDAVVVLRVTKHLVAAAVADQQRQDAPDLGTVRWRETTHGITLTAPSGSRGGQPSPARLVGGLADRTFRPWVAVVGGATRIGERLLWANATASVLYAATSPASAATPLLPAGAAALALADHVPGGLLAVLDVGRSCPRFRRLACCLIDRAPGHGRCDECPMHRPQHRSNGARNKNESYSGTSLCR